MLLAACSARAPRAQECDRQPMISPDYARNFICDFILGKQQAHTEQTFFDLPEFTQL